MSQSRIARLEQARAAEPRPVDVPATIATFRQEGNLLWLSGQVAAAENGLVATGTVGADVDLETARRCARQCALNLLAQAEQAVGLDTVESVLRITVYVASTPDFHAQHLVAHAATDVFTEVLGGSAHVRTALGVAALPLGSPVEADAVLVLRDSVSR
ncbi:RidA family protein [Micromonospora eburnea]|uniref:Enamine deaminase RidA, house cleaning of reactive enamine intermediates, YjgF/YER057c/UK114 family n=1 Tax=Micromonospora eburnea TaxID=227316 RepID=A0A1C6UID7_9ACTN|nr:RidA family protein [Micromonospora eburnea]SCL53855.1 Enamine deaminase RidA, house cleaning of reactive enamine intermediates, YjgF/YER057c/UK114 family [Micromonospora eburnea]